MTMGVWFSNSLPPGVNYYSMSCCYPLMTCHFSPKKSQLLSVAFVDMFPEMEIGRTSGLVAGNLNGFNKLPLQDGKCVFAKKKKKSIPISLLYLALTVWANFHANLRGLGMNSGTVFKLRVYVCRCCRSRQTQRAICNAAGCPDWLLRWEAVLCKHCYQTEPSATVAACWRWQLIMSSWMTAPHWSQRLMKRSRKWRKMRKTDAGPFPCRGKMTKRGLRTRT